MPNRCPYCGCEIPQLPTRDVIYRANELLETKRFSWEEALRIAWIEEMEKENE